MLGQPPVIWDKADGIQIHDKWGNMWLDWSSCVLVANAGHGRKEIVDAVKAMADKPLLATYVFVHEGRAELCEILAKMAPKGLDKVFLLSTGSEATENAIKLARTYGVKKHGQKKCVIVSFEGAFHGRTLGSQLAGGMPALKEWIIDRPASFIQVPFPDGFRCEDHEFHPVREDAGEGGDKGRRRGGGHHGVLSGDRAELPAWRLCPRAGQMVQEARRRADMRRGPVGLRPHGEDVLLRALRLDAGPGLLRQGGVVEPSALGCHRTRRHHESIRSRFDDQHALGQSVARGRGPSPI